MAKQYYYLYERGVWSLLNALEAADVATLQAALVGNTIADDTQLTNAVFTKFSTQLEILNAQEIIGGQCARTEGHPRRVDFRTEIALTHGDLIPTSVGGLGSIYDSTGEMLDPTGASRLSRMRAKNASLVAAGETPTRDLYFTIDGARFLCALVDSAGVAEEVNAELYTYATPFTTFAELATLFSVTTPVESLLYNEFRPALQYLAAGLLAGKVGTYPTEAAQYLQLAQVMSGNLFNLSQIAVDQKAIGAPSS